MGSMTSTFLSRHGNESESKKKKFVPKCTLLAISQQSGRLCAGSGSALVVDSAIRTHDALYSHTSPMQGGDQRTADINRWQRGTAHRLLASFAALLNKCLSKQVTIQSRQQHKDSNIFCN